MLVAALVFHLHQLFGWTGVASFGFAQIYTSSHAGLIGVAWSLDTEVAWYVLLPVFASGAAWLVRRGKTGEWAPVVAFLAIGLMVLVGSHILLSLPSWSGYMLPFWLAHFAAGMLLAIASVRGWEPARRAGSRGAACLLVAACAYAVIAASDYLTIEHVAVPSWTVPVIGDVVSIVFAVALLLPAVFDEGRRKGVRRIIGSRPAIYLGIISYGVYLYHGTGFELASRLGFPGIRISDRRARRIRYDDRSLCR